MDIVALKPETFDTFILKSKDFQKIAIREALEKRDNEIYSRIDRKRFKFIRFDKRSILSSVGILTFKRRYYLDTLTNEYYYLLDNSLQIPKSKRMTNELILKILDLASIMSYKETGEHLSDEFVLSKFTICKTINEVMLETYFDVEINRENKKIHVQIDEKFIGMTSSKNKKKYYTLTIFAGKHPYGNSFALENKTVISSANLHDLKIKLNDILVTRYKVSLEEEIFVSGDFATYIQNFGDSIYCCKTKYVPDKFHVYKTIRDEIPELEVDKYSINDSNFQNFVINKLENNEDQNAKKLKNILKKKPEVFKAYLDPEYLGCSQEGQNSHIYAARFGKYANRFCPSTIEKLSLIREAKAMNAKIVLTHKKRELPLMVDFGEYQSYEDIAKFSLDTRSMKSQSRKLFDAIRYGEI